MKCIEVRENLDEFIDDEIVSSAKEMVKSHLKSCASCTKELRGLRNLGQSLKQALPKTAPAFLDDKVLTAFRNQSSEKRAFHSNEKPETLPWFGIPRFAFASAFLILALVSSLAFQLGRMSAANIDISLPLNAQNNNELPLDESLAEKSSLNKKEKRPAETTVVEIPVIKERIVKVPVIKKQIVTKTIFVASKASAKGTNARDKRVYKRPSSSRFQVATDINPQIIEQNENDSEFQVAPDLNPRIVKKGGSDEK